MPMNEVDQMLSDAADVVQDRLTEDEATREATLELLKAGQSPMVRRELPGIGQVTITIGR